MVAFELSAEELMRTVNAGVVPKYAQRAVCLRFVEPVPLARLETLICIRLTEEQLTRGETLESRWRVLTTAPECGMCGGLTDVCRDVPAAYRCRSQTCPAHAKPVHQPLTSGVQSILHHPAWIAGYDEASWCDYETGSGGVLQINRALPIMRTAKLPRLSACLVVLDCNYDATVLAAVYRSCGAIGDMLGVNGWRLAR